MDHFFNRNQISEQSNNLRYNTNDYHQNNINVIEDTETQYDIKNNFIIINSKDRDWINNTNETPYRFSVKLGGSHTDTYSVTTNEYKNISYIEVNKMMLNDRAITNTSNVITTKISSLPYIQCKFKNFSRLIDGTNSTFDSSMGIFVSSLAPVIGEEHEYVNFDNQLPNGKTFQPIPLGTLNMIDLELLNPQGNIVKNNTDVLNIKSIHINNETSITKNDYLIITTNNFFDKNEFRTGDMIQCKNYEFHNNDYDESYSFNNFINSSNCHTITDISKSNNDTELYNRIHIQLPSYLSRNTGNLVIESWFTSFLIKSLDTTAIDSNKGKLINLSTQSHFVLHIDTLQKELKKNFSLI
jgi:hypothetical protein